MQVTHDVTDLTFASFLSEVGKKTDLTARFSTVVHERGSPETMRDVRGFSVKVMTDVCDAAPSQICLECMYRYAAPKTDR